MGMDRTIQFSSALPPTWEVIQTRLRQLGETPVLRMIDGLPAFPNEMPAEGWNELRVGLTAGMVTLRRTPDGLSCVVWGNADPALRAAWDKVCWACAAGGGVIVTTSGAQTPEQFASATGIQPS